MAEELPWRGECRDVKIVIGAGMHDQLDRNSLALLARDAPIVAAFGQVAAFRCRRPVIELPNPDPCRPGHVTLEAEAGRKEADGRAKFVLGATFDSATLHRQQRQPAPL